MTNSDQKLTLAFRRADPLPAPHDIRLGIGVPPKMSAWRGVREGEGEGKRGEGRGGVTDGWLLMVATSGWLVGCLVASAAATVLRMMNISPFQNAMFCYLTTVSLLTGY